MADCINLFELPSTYSALLPKLNGFARFSRVCEHSDYGTFKAKNGPPVLGNLIADFCSFNLVFYCTVFRNNFR